MIILGIDTAIRCTGYGVVEMKSGEPIRIIDCGVIKNSQTAPHSECLRRIAGGIREIIITNAPQTASIEDVFVNRNIKTAMILSYARGAVMTVLAESRIPIYAYSPRKAKLAVCGTGTASKIQVAMMLSSILGLKTDEIPLDSTDALSLAICHGQIITKADSDYLLPKAF